MNSSAFKTFLTYAAIGGGIAVGLLFWNARHKTDLLPAIEADEGTVITADHPLRLRPSVAETKSELTQTVQGQLDAFRANDYAKAFGFAAKGIQADFTLKNFEEMVKRNYAVIAEWKSVRFGVALNNGSQGQLPVFIQGDGKLETEFQYTFQKEDGTWKIIGVTGMDSVPPQ